MAESLTAHFKNTILSRKLHPYDVALIGFLSISESSQLKALPSAPNSSTALTKPPPLNRWKI